MKCRLIHPDIGWKLLKNSMQNILEYNVLNRLVMTNIKVLNEECDQYINTVSDNTNLRGRRIVI